KNKVRAKPAYKVRLALQSKVQYLSERSPALLRYATKKVTVLLHSNASAQIHFITLAFGCCLIRCSETALLSAFHSSLSPVPDHQRYACQRYSTDPVHPELARHRPAHTTLFGGIVKETHAKDRLPSVSQVLCNSGDYVLIRRLGVRRPWSLLQSSS
ncbi:hypothetical protein IG631_24348, partial [Alternaria alternata]